MDYMETQPTTTQPQNLLQQSANVPSFLSNQEVYLSPSRQFNHSLHNVTASYQQQDSTNAHLRDMNSVMLTGHAANVSFQPPDEDLRMRKRKGEEIPHFNRPTSNDELPNTSFSSSHSKIVKKDHNAKQIEPQMKHTTAASRNVFARFGASKNWIRCKIICKEPWGTLVEMLEDGTNDENEPIMKGSRFWCRWDGNVNIYTTPILEVMYPC